MSGGACEITHTWVCATTLEISLASGANKLGCKLVSGSLSTIAGGGRGDSIIGDNTKAKSTHSCY